MRMTWCLFILAACGGGGGGGGSGPDAHFVAPATCADPGSGAVLGSVGSASFATVADVHVQSEDDTGAFAVVLQDSGSLCESATYDHGLYLFFCDNPPASGTYAIVGSLGCTASGQAAAQLKSDSGATTVTATGGSVTIAMSGDTCVTGTFSVAFDGGDLQGEFGGEYCRGTGN